MAKKKPSLLDKISELPNQEPRSHKKTWDERLEKSHPEFHAQLIELSKAWASGERMLHDKFPRQGDFENFLMSELLETCRVKVSTTSMRTLINGFKDA